MATLAQLDQWVLDILKAQANDTNYSTALRYSAINKAIFDVCSGNLINPQTQDRVSKGNLTFLETTKRYQVERPMMNIATLSSGIGAFSVSSAQWVTPGFATINKNVFQFTGSTTSPFPEVLTWVTLIDFAHPISSRIEKLYTLPINNLFITKVSYHSTNQRSQEMDFVAYTNWESRHFSQSWDRRLSSIHQNRPIYTIVQGKYILVDGLSTQHIIEVEYQKTPNVLSNLSDVCIIPDVYLQPTTTSTSGAIVELACAYIFRDRGEPDEAMKYQSIAFHDIFSLYATEGKKTTQEQTWRIKTAWDSIFNVY